MDKAPHGMVDVRSSEGRLLARVTRDGRMLEIVQRRRRYLVDLEHAGQAPRVVVCAVIEEEQDTIQT